MIEYEFRLDDGHFERFAVDPRRTLPLVPPEEAPEWTRLAYHRCSNCPLDEAGHERCPAAVDVSHIVDRFKSVISHARALVVVKTPEREYRRTVDVQTSLHSLLGLVMATSGCPLVSQLKPLAHHHLPFATKEETVFRSVGAYLLRQYFVAKDGGTPDLELTGLKQLYTDLQTVNRCFTDRVRAAADKDANLNAIVLLFSLSVLVLFTLDDELAQVREQYGL